MQKVNGVKSVDLAETYPDVLLNPGLFIALNALWSCDFPHCPSCEAWSQHDHLCIQRLSHKTADSSTEIAWPHTVGIFFIFFNKYANEVLLNRNHIPPGDTGCRNLISERGGAILQDLQAKH